MQKVLELKNVSKIYSETKNITTFLSKNDDAFVAVDNVSFEIKEGEFFSLLGPSGCGKTTLLRLLAGFEYPTTGNLLIDGVDITELSPDKRPTNMVFQNYAIFPHLNVQKNIQFGLRKLGLSNDEINKRVKDVLSLVKLEGYEERFSNQLSGGQRQRVALARALVRQPKVLLLDEPSLGIAPKLVNQIFLAIKNINKEKKVTIFLVEQNAKKALELADRAYVLVNGKVTIQGSGKELLKNQDIQAAYLEGGVKS